MFAPNTKIVIADDMRTMRKILRKHLSDLGFAQIVDAEDGAQAWHIIESSIGPAPVQIVISDWNMPNMKGIELLQKVRADARTASTIFIMVTAEVEADSQKQVIEGSAKVDGFLSKPFKAQQLREILETLAIAHKAA